MMTFRSKTLAAVLFAALFVLPAYAADTTAPIAQTPAHIALAKAYVAAVPVEDEVKAAIADMAQKVAPDQRALFKQLGETSVDYTRLRTSAEQSVAQVFTDDEIKAMTTFYSSPEGQSVRVKMKMYDALMAPVMHDVMQQFAVRLQQNDLLPKGQITQ